MIECLRSPVAGERRCALRCRGGCVLLGCADHRRPGPQRRTGSQAWTGSMVRFRILGPLEVRTDQDWSGIGAQKWRALLATLLLNPGQLVSTDRLITEIWADDPPAKA